MCCDFDSSWDSDCQLGICSVAFVVEECRGLCSHGGHCNFRCNGAPCIFDDDWAGVGFVDFLEGDEVGGAEEFEVFFGDVEDFRIVDKG